MDPFLLFTAINIALQYHKDQLYGDDLYITHLTGVALYFQGDQFKRRIVSILHDILETTDCTEEVLKEEGFPDDIIDSIKTISRLKNETYVDYIDRVIQSDDSVAIDVKYADLLYNYTECLKTQHSLTSRYGRALSEMRKSGKISESFNHYRLPSFRKGGRAV